MTQEEKQLLMVDLSARLPYGVMITNSKKEKLLDYLTIIDLAVEKGYKPYLRPMSSMTEEEKKIYFEISSHLCGEIVAKTMIDWLNKKMFDYRGLIHIKLALEAPKDMYK